MKVIIENEDKYERHFGPEIQQAKKIKREIKDKDLDLVVVAELLKNNFPCFYVYRGGNHVALHMSRNYQYRLMIITK